MCKIYFGLQFASFKSSEIKVFISDVGSTTLCLKKRSKFGKLWFWQARPNFDSYQSASAHFQKWCDAFLRHRLFTIIDSGFFKLWEIK